MSQTKANERPVLGKDLMATTLGLTQPHTPFVPPSENPDPEKPVTPPSEPGLEPDVPEKPHPDNIPDLPDRPEPEPSNPLEPR